MFVATGGGGRTPVLCPVTHNLARVCPPLEGLHVSSAANHETHVRRESPFLLFNCLKGSGGFILVCRHKTLSDWPCTVAKKCVLFASVLPPLDYTTILSPIPSSFPCLPHSPFLPPPSIHLHHVDLSDCQCLFQLDST